MSVSQIPLSSRLGPEGAVMSTDPKYPVHPLAKLHSFEATLSQYEEALAQLQEWGLQLNPTSRVVCYRDLLREAVERDPPYALRRDLERLSFILLEICEIIEIVNAFESPSSQDLRKFACLAKGNVHPDEDTSSLGRNTQYELWLRTFFQGKGVPCAFVEPVRPNRTPDLMLSWKGKTIPLEAKRPGSDKSIDNLYQKALEQLDFYPQGGIVALSLDLLLRLRGQVLNAESPLGASQLMDLLFLDKAKALISRHSPLTKRGIGKNAIGFLFTAKLPAFSPGCGGAFATEFRQELFWAESDPRREILTGLRSRISSYVSAGPHHQI